MPQIRRPVRILFGALPVALLVVAVWRLSPFEPLPAGIAAPLAAVVLMNFAIYQPLRVARWRVALAEAPRFTECWAAMLEGQVAGLSIGLGAADLVRSARLRPGAERLARDLGSTLAERATEYATLSALLLAASIAGAAPAAAGAAGAGFLCVYAAALVFGRPIAAGLSRWPRLSSGLSAGLDATTPARLVAVAALSLAGWAVEATLIAISLAAFDLTADPATIVLVLLGINAAIAIPAAPANIGMFEAGVVAALASRGVDPSPALAFAMAYHAIHAVPVAIAGTALLIARRPRPPGARGQPQRQGREPTANGAIARSNTPSE